MQSKNQSAQHGAVDASGLLESDHDVDGVIVRDKDEDEATSDAPIYAAGELETWGDYLEAELRREQARRSQ